MPDEGLGPSLQPGPSHTESISSFLGYMQRRLSDFAAPRREDGGQGSRDYATEESAAEGLTSQPDASNHHLNESPSLHRAGLLQPKSYNAPNSLMQTPDSIQPHSPDSIRATTVQLSKLAFPASVASGGGGVGSFRSFHDMAAAPPAVGANTGSADDQQPSDASSGFIFPQTLPLAESSSSTSSLGLDLEPDQTSILSPSLSSSFVRYLPSSAASASGSGSGLESSVATLPSPGSSERKKKPSGLSLLRPPSASNPTSPTSSRSSSLSSRGGPDVPALAESPAAVLSPVAPTETTPTATPMGTPRPLMPGLPPPVQSNANHVHWRRPGSLGRQADSSTPSPSAIFHSPPPSHGILDENTPLLSSQRQLHHVIDADALDILGSQFPPGAHHKLVNGLPSHHSAGGEDEDWGPRTVFSDALSRVRLHLGKPRLKVDSAELKATLKNQVYRAPEHARTAVKAIPAVLLGCLLNILDGVSYGMIIFPATGVFADLGPMGVSMFFVSAIVSQLVYTFGGSGFAGANGSMMIEVVVSTFRHRRG
ncbi:hypothetical protein BDN70DRAFT_276355 [Pholiota conissans]|uniref:Sulfate transporter n=1 Tax=Pholiota conissans TaxID=109636 RepID=A0A9P5Z9L9_9AGAR|nr:hypothetical protein BDN70DRAFT_276355 [Pholiota conissans]